ncbi:hypothetical protein K469DRAFT_589660 [Zopfia rhizophila CBS 207.26]|uniref:F-box domain-containing protein n=1 Tax=Zopfia rhizophila CBS 207.26 TaxID=1314779 RepID=A0A6A6DNS6_9PEZI|nr:hypothetical protein K469DRAFT_589660 [Zopfia rhizophila CBS 207.26]
MKYFIVNKPSKLITLPDEILHRIASFCPYSTVLTMGRVCRALRWMTHDPSLARIIADTVYQESRFSLPGIWSAQNLDLEQAKSICVAIEMALASADKSEMCLAKLAKWWSLLVIYSHPLVGVMNVKSMQLCLHVARYYGLTDLVSDIAFCLVATALEQDSPDNHIKGLKVFPDHSEGLVFIANCVIGLQRPQERRVLRHQLPRASCIPFKLLLGEVPRHLTVCCIKNYDEHLQSLLSPSFLDARDWHGVYFRELDRYYPLDSINSMIRDDQGRLAFSCVNNGVAWVLNSKYFTMTPFGLVVSCGPAEPGAIWLWRKEWCCSEGSTTRPLYSKNSAVDYISCSIKMTVSPRFSAVADGSNGRLTFRKDDFLLEDAEAMQRVSETFAPS